MTVLSNLVYMILRNQMEDLPCEWPLSLLLISTLRSYATGTSPNPLLSPSECCLEISAAVSCLHCLSQAGGGVPQLRCHLLQTYSCTLLWRARPWPTGASWARNAWELILSPGAAHRHWLADRGYTVPLVGGPMWYFLTPPLTQTLWFFLTPTNSPVPTGCCCAVAQVCPALCSPLDCSTPGFSVLHGLPKFAQTHVHWVSDAVQPPHPLPPPSPPALSLSQHQSLFQRVSSHWVYTNSNSNAIYSESVCIGSHNLKGSVPQDSPWLSCQSQVASPGHLCFCPTDYKFRHSYNAPLSLIIHWNDSENSRKCSTYIAIYYKGYKQTAGWRST